MQRKKPPDPLTVAAFDLLRHIGEPSALYANGLVSAYVSGGRCLLTEDALVTQIDLHVQRALEALVREAGPRARSRAVRLRGILERYDIAGENRSDICACLGITERHFFRERQIAAHRFVDCFLRGSALAKAREPLRLTDPYHAYISGALAVAETGNAHKAALMLTAPGSTEHDPHRKVVAWTEATKAFLDASELSEAQRMLTQSRKIVETYPRLETRLLEGEGRFDLAAALVMWDHAESSEAFVLAQRALNTLYRVRRALEPSSRELFVREALRWAARVWSISRLDQALPLVSRAREVLNELPDAD